MGRMRFIPILILLLLVLVSLAQAIQQNDQETEEKDQRGISLARIPNQKLEYYRSTWAVVIGINDYPGGSTGLNPLQFAVNDAREFKTILCDEFGYKEKCIQYLTDKEATQHAIKKVFQEWLPNQKITENDSVLVFFAGHGLADRSMNKGYLAAVDSLENDLEGSCLAVSWVKDKLAELTCRHKLLILDSCYSGTLFQQEKRLTSTSTQKSPELSNTKDIARSRAGSKDSSKKVLADNLSYYLQNPAFLGISAGRFTPVADGLKEQRHSVFTSTLLSVLRERADSPREDHIFTFRQLAAQVETRVANALGSQQIPDWGRLGPGNGDFIFKPTQRRITPREKLQESERFLEENMRLTKRTLEMALNLGSSRQDQFQILGSLRKLLDNYLSLTLQTRPPDEKVYQYVLAWKGSLFLRESRNRQSIFKAAMAPIISKLQSATSEFSKAVYAMDVEDHESWKLKLQGLIEEMVSLERELLQRQAKTSLPDQESDTQQILTKVRQFLPPDSAIIDFLVYEFKPAEDNLPVSRKEERLLAFVTCPNKDIKRIELGPAEAMQNAIDEFLDALLAERGILVKSIKSRVIRANTRLRSLIWEPIENHVKNAKTVFISPDAFVGKLPFEILILEDQTYLIEHYSTIYLQDIASIERAANQERRGGDSTDRQMSSSLLVIGALDYSKRKDTSSNYTEEKLDRLISHSFWGSLLSTRHETGEIAKLHQASFGKNVTHLLLQDETPTEERLKAELPRFNVIHLATHGFFEPEGIPSMWDLKIGRKIARDYPGIYSGLVCAGVNVPASKGMDEGFLTAEEIYWLDLRNCDLVVLSACQTGLGKSQKGEGMLGLQRTLHVAGAKTVVSSVWKVRDRSTTDLMLDFYRGLWTEKLGKNEALRRAKLKMLAENRMKYKGEGLPSTWGSFILSGDWR